MHVRTFDVTCDDLADGKAATAAQSQSSKQQSANPTTTIMKDPITSTCASNANVSGAVKHAVNRIISEDEGADCRRDENTIQTGQVARPITKHPRSLSSSNSNTCTVSSVLEELSSPHHSEEIAAQSSHSYVYSTVLQCASLDEWDVAASLLLLGAFLEMRYEFRPERVLAMKQQPKRAITASESSNLLGDRCGFSSYANIPSDKATGTSVHLAPSTMTSSIDGVALVHEAKLFIRAHLANDDPISKPSNMLAFILHKLPEQWVDRAYLRIDRYVQKKPTCMELSSLVRVIMRNASSYEEESCYRVSSNWTVDMILGVFISQSGHGPKTFQFLLPSSNKRDYTDYSFGSKSRRAQEKIGSCTLDRLAEGKAEVVIYFDAILAPCLLV